MREFLPAEELRLERAALSPLILVFTPSDSAARSPASPARLRRCRRKSSSRTMATCKGFRSHNVKCTRLAMAGDSYCNGHQYQADPANVCKGQTAKKHPCYARAKTGTSYCREQHKPSFVQHVAPEDLREEWDIEKGRQLRKDVVEEHGSRLAYVRVSGNCYPTHLDHVYELQLAAEAANVAVVKRYDHGQTESQKNELVELLRDIANRVENLRITSAPVNVLKGDACTRLIESWRAHEDHTTFTDCMTSAKSSKYPRHKLREETGSIRSTMLAVSKQQLRRVENEAEDNELTVAFLEQMKKTRVELRK